MTLIGNALVAGALLCKFTVAQSGGTNSSTDCTSDFDHGFNASGSVTVPGPRVNNSYPESSWTFTRYMTDLGGDDKEGYGNVEETLGLKTSPLQILLDPNVPYQGCFIAPIMDDDTIGGDDDGTCSSVLGSDCIENIISNVNGTAAEYSVKPLDDDVEACDRLARLINPSSCSKSGGGSHGWNASPFLSPFNASETCPVTNPGDMNATNAALHFSWGRNGKSMLDAYNHAIQASQPIIMALWLRPTNDSSAKNLPWAHTQVMCIKANNVAPGSSKGAAVIKNDGVAVRAGARGAFVFVGLAVLISIVL